MLNPTENRLYHLFVYMPTATAAQWRARRCCCLLVQPEVCTFFRQKKTLVGHEIRILGGLQDLLQKMDGLRKPSLRTKRGCSVLAMRGQLYLWVERKCLMCRIHLASKVGMLHTFTVQPWVGQSWITSFLIWIHTGLSERVFVSLFTNELPLSASKYSFAKEYG